MALERLVARGDHKLQHGRVLMLAALAVAFGHTPEVAHQRAAEVMIMAEDSTPHALDAWAAPLIRGTRGLAAMRTHIGTWARQIATRDYDVPVDEDEGDHDWIVDLASDLSDWGVDDGEFFDHVNEIVSIWVADEVALATDKTVAA